MSFRTHPVTSAVDRRAPNRPAATFPRATCNGPSPTFDVQRSTFDVRRSPASSAFTLLEVILAIAIAGFVMAAATSFVFSVSNIWVDRQERHFFEDHVDGVTEFLRAAFANAGVEIALEDSTDSKNTNDNHSGGDNSGNGDDGLKITPNVGRSTKDQNQAKAGNGGLVRVSEEPVGWGKPPGFADYQEPLLNFKLTEIPPLLVNPDDAPISGIDAFLYFDPQEGLSLLWYSILQEEAEDLNDLRRTQLSTLVKEIHYIYWDERFEKWEAEEKPKEGEGNDQYILPRFVKLTFEYEGETKERTLTIPVPSKNALIF